MKQNGCRLWFYYDKTTTKKQQHLHIKQDIEAGVCNWKHFLKHCPVVLINDIKKLFEICKMTHWQISGILEHCDVNIPQTSFLFSNPLINNFANDKMFSNLDKPGRFKHTLCHASTCKKVPLYLYDWTFFSCWTKGWGVPQI